MKKMTLGILKKLFTIEHTFSQRTPSSTTTSIGLLFFLILLLVTITSLLGRLTTIKLFCYVDFFESSFRLNHV